MTVELVPVERNISVTLDNFEPRKWKLVITRDGAVVEQKDLTSCELGLLRALFFTYYKNCAQWEEEAAAKEKACRGSQQQSQGADTSSQTAASSSSTA